MLSKTILDRIEKRAKRATKGPWVRWVGTASVLAGPVVTNEFGSIEGGRGNICECCEDEDTAVRNARYIATVHPRAILKLVRELKEYRKSAEIYSVDPQAAPALHAQYTARELIDSFVHPSNRDDDAVDTFSGITGASVLHNKKTDKRRICIYVAREEHLKEIPKHWGGYDVVAKVTETIY